MKLNIDDELRAALFKCVNAEEKIKKVTIKEKIIEEIKL